MLRISGLGVIFGTFGDFAILQQQILCVPIENEDCGKVVSFWVNPVKGTDCSLVFLGFSMEIRNLSIDPDSLKQNRDG